MIHKYNTALV